MCSSIHWRCKAKVGWVGMPGRETPWEIISRGVFCFFWISLLLLLGRAGLDMGVGWVSWVEGEMAEGAMVGRGLVFVCFLGRIYPFFVGVEGEEMALYLTFGDFDSFYLARNGRWRILRCWPTVARAAVGRNCPGKLQVLPTVMRMDSAIVTRRTCVITRLDCMAEVTTPR